MTESLLTTVATRPAELLVWSAATAEGLPAARQALLARIEAAPESLPELARESRHGAHDAYRGAVVGTDAASVVAALRRGRGLEGARPAVRRPVAFLLSGVGDQYPGMGAELYRSEPVFRDAVDRCCAVLEADGCDLLDLLVRPVEQTPRLPGDLRAMLRPRQVPQGPLATTRYGQPGVFVLEYALAELVRSWGVEPAAMIGYSLGEYVAACLAGVMSLPDALRLVRWRAERIEELAPGGMLAVALTRDEIGPWLGADLDVAAVTSPFQTVLGGPRAAVADLERRLTDAGVVYQRVGAHHGFHTRTMEPLGARLTAWIRANVRLAGPRIPYVSNITGGWLTDAQATDPAYWAQHLARPVELMSGLGTLWREVDPVAIELGPGEGLSSSARHHPACDRARLARVQPGLAPAFAGRSETAGLLTSLGRLWTAGLDLDWARFTNDTPRSDS
ncbi:acyltransferase domain-containing protein [Micromonospora eburnea]|uniref:Acyl transferase domain-containing protein n=1 Tax=Micromonospora eburnea TaxID=227316 RepID=A0A1C6UVT6_9ACTN|nr:acyltransferase domain-containing protein [Micromonospora eburnea]SCL57929.1 Acyl transferase domain-containing protein [Micromonospora eburnea]